MFNTVLNIMLYAIARTHTDHENYWLQTFDMHTKERIAATAIFPFSYVPSSMFDVRTMLMIGLFIVGY